MQAPGSGSACCLPGVLTAFDLKELTANHRIWVEDGGRCEFQMLQPSSSQAAFPALVSGSWCYLWRFLHFFGKQRSDGEPHRKIAYVAKLMESDSPRLINQDKAGRSLHLISAHGKGHALRWTIVLINPDRKPQSVFIHEYLERVAAHHLMVFENSMQSDHRYPAWIKFLGYSLCLGDPHLYATRTENLKGMQYNHLAAQ